MNAEMLQPRLLALNGPAQGVAFALGETATLGRSAECEISLDLASISRRHARFECRAGVCTVKDLGSRNGVKVNGRAVQETELRPGDVVTIGELDLQFDLAGGTPTLAPVATGTAPSLSPGPAQDAGKGSAQVSIGLNLKMLLVIIAAFILSIAAGVLLLKLKAARDLPKEAGLPPVLLKADENKWIQIGNYDRVKVGGTVKRLPMTVGDFAPDIAVSQPEVVEAEKFREGELLIRGKAGGDADIALTMRNGMVLHIPVLVRGRLEDPLEPLTYGAYSPDERRIMAEQFVQSALQVEDENPAVALQEYNKAIAVAEPLPDKGRAYLQARDRKHRVEGIIEVRWDRLYGEISLAMNNNEYARAALLLEEAMRLIADPNDPRYQRAKYYLRGVRAMMVRENAQKGG